MGPSREGLDLRAVYRRLVVKEGLAPEAVAQMTLDEIGLAFCESPDGSQEFATVTEALEHIEQERKQWDS